MNEGKQRCIEHLAIVGKPVGPLSDQVVAFQTLHTTELLPYYSRASLPTQVLDSGCSAARAMSAAAGHSVICPWNPRATTGMVLAPCLLPIPSHPRPSHPRPVPFNSQSSFVPGAEAQNNESIV